MIKKQVTLTSAPKKLASVRKKIKSTGQRCLFDGRVTFEHTVRSCDNNKRKKKNVLRYVLFSKVKHTAYYKEKNQNTVKTNFRQRARAYTHTRARARARTHARTHIHTHTLLFNFAPHKYQMALIAAVILLNHFGGDILALGSLQSSPPSDTIDISNSGYMPANYEAFKRTSIPTYVHVLFLGLGLYGLGISACSPEPIRVFKTT